MLLGFALVVVVLLDVLASTIRTEEEGRLTRVVQQFVCMGFSGLYRITGRSVFLTWSGIMVIVSMVVTWVLLLWAGWLLVFASAPGAVVSADTGEPAGLWELVYFSGFAISTLGTGDYVASGSLWLVLTSAAALTGLFTITFIISFIVPVAQAEAFRREVALSIYHSGASAQELLLDSWDEDERTAFGPLLDEMTPTLVALEQRHMHNPVLHRFHGSLRTDALELGIASLDEALSIAEHGLEAPLPKKFGKARRAIDGYLGTLGAAWVKPAEKAPPAPSLAALRERGLPAVDDDLLAERFRKLDERRRLLRALVERSGWSWSLVHGGAGDASDGGKRAKP